MIAKDLCDLGGYDLFTRTTTGNHEHVVQEMFKQCLENGYIYKGTQQVAISPSTGRTCPTATSRASLADCHAKVRVATSATPAATGSARTSSHQPSPRLTAKPRASSRPSTTSSTCRGAVL